MKTEVTQRTYFSSYGTFRTRYCSLESLQIYIVIWVHCAWKENFTTYLFSAYYENTKPCQRICSKVHWNLLLFWAMEFPDPTSECFFLLVRRNYREDINYLLLLTWQHTTGQILHTDDIKWNVSIHKKKSRERSFRFTLLVAFGTCSQVTLQKVPRDLFKVTSAFIFIVITIFPMNYFFIL